MDIRILSFASALSAVSTSVAVPQVVEDSVSMAQDAATGRVTVSYRLTEPGIVTADIETNATGDVWASIGGVNCCDLLGEVNRLVVSTDSTQLHTFTWQPRSNWPGHEIAVGKCRAVLKVWKKTDPPDYVAVDLSGTKEKLFFADVDHLPGRLGATNLVYKTEKMLMRRIPAAYVTWQMGSRSTDRGRSANNELQRSVTLTKDYYMGVFMVTRYQHFRVLDPNTFYISQVTGINPLTEMSYMTEPKSEVNYTSLRGNEWPTTEEPSGSIVSWRDRVGIPGLDIPTEAQWEYACRAGSPASWCNGYDRSNNTYWTYDATVAEVCWYNESKKREFTNITSSDTIVPVGLLKPNAWGLYDMHGNFWEFCRDWYVENDLYGGTDPKGASAPASNKYRVGRGGTSGYAMHYTRSAARYGYHSNYGNGCYRLMCLVDELFED